MDRELDSLVFRFFLLHGRRRQLDEKIAQLNQEIEDFRLHHPERIKAWADALEATDT